MTAQLRWPSTNQKTAWRTFLVVGGMREEYPRRGTGQEIFRMGNGWRRAPQFGTKQGFGKPSNKNAPVADLLGRPPAQVGTALLGALEREQ
jgi:hypothetical protein